MGHLPMGTLLIQEANSQEKKCDWLILDHMATSQPGRAVHLDRQPHQDCVLWRKAGSQRRISSQFQKKGVGGQAQPPAALQSLGRQGPVFDLVIFAIST